MSYILGVRMRKTADIRDQLVDDEAPFIEVEGPRTTSRIPRRSRYEKR